LRPASPTSIILNDHGGGTNVYGQVAKKLEEKVPRARAGVSQHPCAVRGHGVREGAGDFDAWLKEHNLPVSGHAGIPDTSTMMYLQELGQEAERVHAARPAAGGGHGAQSGGPAAPRPVASGVTATAVSPT
jgi:creatinine amidohydrolase/Fe(II)-dependent formamide hydrolase-like protein